MAAHVGPHFGPHRQENALALVVAGTVLVRLAEVTGRDGPVDGSDDLAQGDVFRGARQHVAAPHATLRADEACALAREEDLLEVGLGEPRAFGEPLHRRRGLRAGVEGEGEERAARVVAPGRDPHGLIVLPGPRRGWQRRDAGGPAGRVQPRRDAYARAVSMPTAPGSSGPALGESGAPGSTPSSTIWPGPIWPAYGRGSLADLLPALQAVLAGMPDQPSWLPAEIEGARQVVLLVLDGLGAEQLEQHREDAPFLAGMPGGAISSVAPTTTATALTSITTGLSPARHGVVGYRIRARNGEILNVLRWCAPSGDARGAEPPELLQPNPPFGGRAVTAVTRAEFAGTGFSEAHLRGAELRGWRVPSSLPVEVALALEGGAPFVFAYYDGVDKVAHERGLGRHYRAELRATDRLVGDVAAALPPGSALVVTSDHGQVEVGPSVVALEPDVLAGDVVQLSGEGRWRWLHVRPGREEALAARLEQAYGQLAWVRLRRDLERANAFGGSLGAEVRARLGDVALLARAPVAFADPADQGELALVSRHGSLTAAELSVPLRVCVP